MRTLIFRVFFAAAAMITLPSMVRAQSAPCLGYDPVGESWQPVSPANTACPANSALLSVLHGSGAVADPAQRMLIGSCCVLPRGMLTGETEVATRRCPANSVAIGTVMNTHLTPARIDLLCGFLDTTRFTLSEPQLGAEVSSNRGHLGELVDEVRGIDSRRLPVSRIPAAFRYGVGRMGRTRWNFPACIGMPFEGILVGRFGKRCVEHEFANVLDRETGKPVPLFPPCAQVRDPLDPGTGCLPP